MATKQLQRGDIVKCVGVPAARALSGVRGIVWEISSSNYEGFARVQWIAAPESRKFVFSREGYWHLTSLRKVGHVDGET